MVRRRHQPQDFSIKIIIWICIKQSSGAEVRQRRKALWSWKKRQRENGKKVVSICGMQFSRPLKRFFLTWIEVRTSPLNWYHIVTAGVWDVVVTLIRFWAIGYMNVDVNVGYDVWDMPGSQKFQTKIGQPHLQLYSVSITKATYSLVAECNWISFSSNIVLFACNGEEGVVAFDISAHFCLKCTWDVISSALMPFSPSNTAEWHTLTAHTKQKSNIKCDKDFRLYFSFPVVRRHVFANRTAPVEKTRSDEQAHIRQSTGAHIPIFIVTFDNVRCVHTKKKNIFYRRFDSIKWRVEYILRDICFIASLNRKRKNCNLLHHLNA